MQVLLALVDRSALEGKFVAKGIVHEVDEVLQLALVGRRRHFVRRYEILCSVVVGAV